MGIRLWHHFCWFCLAVLTAAAAASIMQTQFNLAALTELGLAIAWQDWLATTWFDLTSFGPVVAGLFAGLLAITLTLGHWVQRWLIGRWHLSRPLWLMLSSAIGCWVMLWLINSVAPMPTLIAATRSGLGVLTFMLCAALGAWVYSREQTGGEAHE